MYQVFNQISPTWPLMTEEQLKRINKPVFVAGGNKEMISVPLFSTATYVAAGSARLDFFNTVDAGNGLTNMEAANQLPSGKFFNIREVRCHVVLPAVNDADPQTWIDMDNIINVGRPILTLTIDSKPIGGVPLSHCVAKGGLTGNGHNMADATATSQTYANNGNPGAPGWDLEWMVWIPQQVSFGVRIDWFNAQAVAADTPVRVELHGHYYRNIN